MNCEPTQILSSQLHWHLLWQAEEQVKCYKDGGSEENIVMIENVATSWFLTDP